MEISPNGFLHRVYCLQSLSRDVLAEVAEPDDHSDADAGELMVIPDGGDAFVGLESMGEATVARVVELSGDELLGRLQNAARLMGDESGVLEMELLRHCLTLSTRLSRLAEAGSVVRLVCDGTAYLTTPTGGRLAVGTA
jgi:hypothetical protein